MYFSSLDYWSRAQGLLKNLSNVIDLQPPSIWVNQVLVGIGVKICSLNNYRFITIREELTVRVISIRLNLYNKDSVCLYLRLSKFCCELFLSFFLTLSLLGYLKTRIRWGGGQFDPPPSKSHVLCPNMTNDTSFESSCALICKKICKFAKIEFFIAKSSFIVKMFAKERTCQIIRWDV